MEDKENGETSIQNTLTAIKIEEPKLQLEKKNGLNNNYNNEIQINEKKIDNTAGNMPEISNNINNLPNEKTSNKAEDNSKKENVPCNEKYSFCFCKIKCSFCVNFCNKKEREEYCNKRSQECCCIIVLLYYYLFLVTEFIYFLFLFIICIFSTICPCIEKYCEQINKANKKQLEERKENDRLFNIQYTKDTIEELKHDKENIDRTIYLNAICDPPECQMRAIELQEKQYDEKIENLEYKLKNMNN